MKKIIFIEGLWGTGKSRICRYMKNKFTFSYIKEPNHIKGGLKNKRIECITLWYLKKHIKNFKNGLKLLENGFNVIIERGPVSSIVFIKTRLENKNRFKKDILYFEKLLKQCYNKPYVIYIEPLNIKKISRSVKRRLYIFNYATPCFLNGLHKNYLEYLNKLSRKGLIKLIKTQPLWTKNSEAKLSGGDIQTNMKIRILARVVIYNKNKILLVRNKGEGFWYPPGGQWEYEKENIIEAAKREVKEEVGLGVNIKKMLYLQEFRPKKDLIFFEIFWLAKLLPGQVYNQKHIDLDPNGQVETASWYSKKDLKDLKVFPKRLKNTFWSLIRKKTENPFINQF